MKRVRKMLVALLVAVMVIGGVLPNSNVVLKVNAAEDENVFADVKESDWYYSFAKYAVENSLMKGKDTDENGLIIFDPTNNITRAEFVQTLYNKEGKPKIEYVDTFTDVPEGKWYTSAILWAAQNGVVKGKGDIFDVNAYITRQEMATVLYNYAEKYLGYETEGRTSLDDFADAASVSSWAVEYMQWALEYGIMKGKGDNLDPLATATRAESATMLKNFIDAYTEGEEGGEDEDEVVHNFAYTADEEGNYVQEKYSFHLCDYIPDIAAGDVVKITAEFASDTYYGGSIQANVVTTESESGVAWKGFADIDNNKGNVVSGTFEVPYGSGYNEVQIQMWWMGESEKGVDLVTLTVERVTGEEEGGEEGGDETTESIYTFLYNCEEGEYVKETYKFKLCDYISDIKAGETVKVTVNLSGKVGFGGAVSGNEKDETAESNYSWKRLGEFSNTSASVSSELVVPFDSGWNEIWVEMWWMNETEDGVDITAITVERVTGEEGGEEEGGEEEGGEEVTGPVHTFEYALDDDGKFIQEKYTFLLKDYLADVAENDTVKITAEFSGNVAFGGALSANVKNEDGTVSWKDISQFGNENTKIEGTMVVPYGNGWNTIQVMMWWMNETEEGVDLVSISVERVTGEEEGGEEEGGEEVAGPVHTFEYALDDDGKFIQEKYTFLLKDYLADVAENDTVKITAEFSGNVAFGGALSANVKNEDGTVSWKDISQFGNENTKIEGTMVVPYGNGWNTIQVMMWWMNETEEGVDLVSVSVERVTE